MHGIYEVRSDKVQQREEEKKSYIYTLNQHTHNTERKSTNKTQCQPDVEREKHENAEKIV